MDGHNNNVTFKKKIGIKVWVTSPSHKSHVLQPLNVYCFKSFDTTFRKVRNVAMFRSNHMELNKITLVGWVDQALKQSLKK